MDWFDGARREVVGDDLELVERMFDWLVVEQEGDHEQVRVRVQRS